MLKLKPARAVTAAFALLLTGLAAQAETPALSPPEPVPAALVAPLADETPGNSLAAVMIEKARRASLFPVSMTVCPNMAKLNRPETDENMVVVNYEPFVLVDDTVTLAAAPVETACISSGFGPRRSGTHKGIDYFNRDPVDIYAAGAGTVKEKTYRNDFGNMLVIDHGNGVFTRYAHLQEFAKGLKEGSVVETGDVIAVMGNTAGYTIARHLHYEVMIGEWGAEAGSFALTPVNIYDLPAPRSDAKS
jgi:murein DD-endopeptidase MepM/ murein hydrolase activator NlpD